jgi:DNA segregation ATPase FtsK/SpoIIIE, S-DNA-T family
MRPHHSDHACHPDASMLKERNIKADLLAFGLAALAVLIAASLLSYDPADPPARLVFPAQTDVNNLCGRSGAVAAAMLLGGFGLGAYYLLISLVLFDALLLAQHKLNDPVLRIGGWLLSLVGISTLAAMALPGFSPGPVIGAGGYLGAAGRGILEMNFANVGACILAISAIVGGLLLATDYLFFRLFALSVGLSAKGVGVGATSVGKAYIKKLSKLSANLDEEDLEDDESAEEEEEEAEEEEPSVKIRGRATAKKDARKSRKTAGKNGKQAPVDDGKKSRVLPLAIRKPRKSKREELIEEIEAAANTDQPDDYELPASDLLLESESFCFDQHEKEVREKAKILEKTFADFGFNIRVVEIQTGPVIAQFEVALEAGLRLNRITGLSDDLAIAMKVPSVRIVAPIPGKNTVGIEVPNEERQLVRLREVIEESRGRTSAMRIPIFLGKDVAGQPLIIDLASMPHLLIAGRTGTGKSVCLNSIIVSMLMTRRPDEVRTIFIDPKMVELSPYKRIPHLMHPVVTDMRKAEAILAWAVEKMEERYQLLARAGVRHLSVYNQLGEEELKERMEVDNDEQWAEIPHHLPYIVIVADEMADLMMTAAKEVEGHIIRLAQKSRAVGIHLVLATQKPTVDVITGLIKSNLPARIAFEVSSRIDSRVVLDEMGADKLLGDGDMLFLRPGTSELIRGQGTYLSDDEINSVIDAVATSEPHFVKELVQLKTKDAQANGPNFTNRDELYEGAVDVVVREGRGSVSLLQRALGIGYGRAARLIDYMEEDGFVGAYNGSQAREVLLTLGDWEEMHGESSEEPPPAPPRRTSNKIRIAKPKKSAIENDAPFDVSSKEEEDDEDEPDTAADTVIPIDTLTATEDEAVPEDTYDDEEDQCEEDEGEEEEGEKEDWEDDDDEDEEYEDEEDDEEEYEDEE